MSSSILSGNFRTVASSCWAKLYAEFPDARSSEEAIELQRSVWEVGRDAVDEDFVHVPVEKAVSDGVDQIRPEEAVPSDVVVEALSVSGCFSIMVDRSAGEQLGIAIQISPTALIVDAIASGLIQSWNASNPSQQVKCGDRLMEVNGILDRKELIDHCKKHVPLKLRFSRLAAVDESASSSTRDEAVQNQRKGSEPNVLAAPQPCARDIPSPGFLFKDGDQEETLHFHYGYQEDSFPFGSGITSDDDFEFRNFGEDLPSATSHMSERMHSNLAYMKDQIKPNGRAVSDKFQKGLVFAKEQAQAASAVISEKAHVASTTMSGKAQLASATFSGKMEKISQTALVFAKGLSKSGGA